MQFRSSTPDLHNFYNSFLQKNRALNALSLLYCTPYTVHPTPRTKNIFYVFFFISRRAYIYVYLPSSHARVRTLFIYTRSLHAVRLYTRSLHAVRLYTALAPIHAYYLTFVRTHVCAIHHQGPQQFIIFGESGGNDRPHQLAEWFGPCDPFAERECRC